MKKVLIIDDHPSIVKGFQRLYSNKPNVVVAQCHSVEQALRAVENHKPDIILLDHSLSPGGDEGWEIVDRLRAAQNTATIYSITGGDRGLRGYEERGIEVVPKNETERFEQLIET